MVTNLFSKRVSTKQATSKPTAIQQAATNSPKMFRRHFLKQLSLLSLVGTFPLGSQALSSETQFAKSYLSNQRPNHSPNSGSQTNQNRGSTLFSGVQDQAGRHWLVRRDQSPDNDHDLSAQIELPGRAHQIVVHPNGLELAVMARRPGAWIYIVDVERFTVRKKLQLPEPYHGFGHAVYTRDGAYLISTENNLNTNQGELSVRDVKNGYREIARHSSFGIGPHQLALLSDQNTLVVANGGILTRPESGRKKLNLDTMAPSLNYIKLNDGKLIDSVTLPAAQHQLSIRHLDLNQYDQVVFAMQFQGEKHELMPLIASHKLSETMRWFDLDDATLYSMKQYCGSVRFDHSGNYCAVSSPVGNKVLILDIASGQVFDQVRCRDACGLAPAPGDGFWISSGTGKVFHYSTSEQTLLRSPHSHAAWRWDNHLA